MKCYCSSKTLDVMELLDRCLAESDARVSGAVTLCQFVKVKMSADNRSGFLTH